MLLEGLPYVLTPMTLDDVPFVAEIERRVFPSPWPATAFRYEIAQNAASRYLVLRYRPWIHRGVKARRRGLWQLLQRAPSDDPSLIGYGGFWLIVDEAHISTLAVRPEWRGRGLGELILSSLIAKALKEHAQLITLEVRASNVVAQNLYRKYGFRVVGRRKGYYSNNREDALIMSIERANELLYRQRFAELRAKLRARLLAQPNTPPEQLLETAGNGQGESHNH